VITDRTAQPFMTSPTGRRLERGDEVSIAGIRGRCAFVQHVTHESGVEWVDIVTSRGFARSVRPSTIRTVHRRRTGIAGSSDRPASGARG
jgi:hypothetical protein